MFKFLTSVKLTLSLLLLLALVSIGGTIAPVESQRYELFYQSLWFRCLLGLLALNLLCCTVKTIKRNISDRERFFARLLPSVNCRSLASLDSVESSVLKLRKAGYRVFTADNKLVAQTGLLGRWGSTLVHLSVLLIMLGAVLGSIGFVGTINTYLGTVNQSYFDWDEQTELPLGIGLRADSFRPVYYPIGLRFDLLDGSGNLLRQVTLKERESFSIDELGLQATVTQFQPDQGVLTVEVFRQQQSLGLYKVDATKSFGTLKQPGFQIKNIEFRDPILKQMETAVTVFLDSKFLQTGTIRVNHPLTLGSVTIYQTAYQYHGNDVWSVGFQLSRDPGEPLVWAGSVLLICGLLVVLLLPYRVVGVVPQPEGGFGLLPLVGFSGEGGQQRLQQLLDKLCG